ncbi:acylphosphatase [Candidatus Woesearchaeota archaeon]|nr:acylphosphatase [Candidatus Woesearchaeota archaeon]
MQKRYRIIISGDVHGVFFRAFVQENAQQLGLKGWVKNVSNKSKKVEAIVEGDEDKIRLLVELCKKGPTSATVENIKAREEKYKGEFTDFSIHY